MALRLRVALWLAIVCLLCGAVIACGATTTAADRPLGVIPRGAGQGLTLHVVRMRPGEMRLSLDTDVDDSATVQHLYAAALQLPVAPSGVYNCGPDNGVVYHLTFMGGTVTQRQMDLDAAGCRFLLIGQQAYWTDNSTDKGFIALFMQTVGITVLDPTLGYETTGSGKALRSPAHARRSALCVA